MTGVAGALCVGLVPASGPARVVDPETLLRQARTLKEYRDCRGAVRVAASLIETFPQSEAARKVDPLLDSCLADLTWKELEEIADHSPVPRVAARAMLILANGRASRDDCTGAIEIFDRITTRYPDTTEAWRAATRKAFRCLEPMGRHEEAMTMLERVVEKAGHSPETAYALHLLGTLHSRREERDEARAAFTRLIRDYPPDFEYPSSPGLKIVKHAQTDLKMLDQYLLSPFLDKIISWARRAMGVERSSSGTWRAWLSVSVVILVDYGVQIAALLLVLLLLWIARLAGLSRSPGANQILARNWSVRRAGALLLVVWTIPFACQLTFILVNELDAPNRLQTLSWVYGDRVVGLVTTGVALVACLWKEPIRRIFAIGRRSLLGVAGSLALFITFGLVTSALRRLILRVSGRSTEPVVLRDAFVGDLSTARAAVVTVVVIVLAAAAEECVYRGVVFEAFSRISNKWVAALLSSILFGAAHVVPLAQFVTITIMGLLLVYLRERSGGLLAPLFLHALNNLVSALARTLR